MSEQVCSLAIPLLSVNVGPARPMLYKGKEARSGIGKLPVDGSAELGLVGIDGDEQADLVNHGGEDKAVCVYSHDHYAHWESVLGRTLGFGAFGENFTTNGLLEPETHIGDVFRVGTAVVQVSQPRQPCWKLSMKWGLDELPALVTQTGATGFYFRVLQAGSVKAGDTLTLVSSYSAAITVAEANRVMHTDKNDIEGIQRLLGVDALSDSWVKQLRSRLERLESSSPGLLL
ncbi:MOSC domain-containing protein [Cohnella faecalis]|uniref:MOSC domain-containing protein n=1 Tax=Cohnella faecalis TaxID=2315694 RepID=A0A398CQM9_9BACL|nr:MOSC domain-containing protein [Cohnella faecalis]RIE04802.1 MOSC domain-containing protein [Cohnella faecalis]